MVGEPITSYSLYSFNALQSVTSEPMDMTASTTVVVTVWTILHVTNKLGIVTKDVTRDIQKLTVAKVYLNCQQIYNTHLS